MDFRLQNKGLTTTYSPINGSFKGNTVKKFQLWLLLFFLVLSGCSQLSDSSHMSVSENYSPTNASDIIILFEAPAEAYTVIGLVESGGLALTDAKKKERSMLAIKKEAASIGANAVIITSSSMKTVRNFDGESAGEENILAGKAIRYK